MEKIDGSPKNLKQLLQNTKYTIHYYQREYMWQRNHIEELLDDLTSEFLENYKPGDSREDVAKYGAYFMGSIVLAENAIIDGQQRFTSLTLLLMYLKNRLRNIGQDYNVIDAMIYSERFGKKSFNIDIEDRHLCMEAIFDDKDFDPSDSSDSVQNLYARYKDIIDIFSSNEIKDNLLFHFCDWLIERVFFIEIVASTEQDAHKVFITMNDRGLRLTSTEMLKGYILSEIKNNSKREKANKTWKNVIFQLKRDSDKDDGDEVFIKAWLRAQYAETIRDTKAGAENKDFDEIGNAFHKWVRENREKLALSTTEDYERFVETFAKFADVYLRIRKAERTFDEKLQYIYYNAQVAFTLQPQLLLAPIKPSDNGKEINEKINLVARFIDLLIISRVTNAKSVAYSTIKNYVFNVTKDIRRCDISVLKEKLRQHYDKLDKPNVSGFRLYPFTQKYVKHMLARITSYIEEQTDTIPNYCNYMQTKKAKNPFEIEHIIPDHFEWFTEEYTDKDDFSRWRNSIGALLLLHKSINASLNDARYSAKIKKYCSTEGNIYTASLGKEAYSHNPRFVAFINAHGLKFKAYDKFGKKEIAERLDLVSQLAALVWNDDAFQ